MLNSFNPPIILDDISIDKQIKLLKIMLTKALIKNIRVIYLEDQSWFNGNHIVWLNEKRIIEFFKKHKIMFSIDLSDNPILILMN